MKKLRLRVFLETEEFGSEDFAEWDEQGMDGMMEQVEQLVKNSVFYGRIDGITRRVGVEVKEDEE